MSASESPSRLLVALSARVARMLACELLVREGFAVVAADASAEAYERAHDRAVRAVITDWSLARDPVLPLLRTLHEDPTTHGLPVLIVGEPHRDELAAAAKLGVRQVVLAREFTAELFLEKSRALVRDAPPRRRSASRDNQATARQVPQDVSEGDERTGYHDSADPYRDRLRRPAPSRGTEDPPTTRSSAGLTYANPLPPVGSRIAPGNLRMARRRLGPLPVLAPVAERLNAMINDSETGVTELASVIALDPLLHVQVLAWQADESPDNADLNRPVDRHAASSRTSARGADALGSAAAQGVSPSLMSLVDTLHRLGVRRVASLLARVPVQPMGGHAWLVEDAWRNVLLTCRAAEHLARHSDRCDPHLARLAVIARNWGRWMTARLYPDLWRDLQQSPFPFGEDPAATEARRLGVSPDDVARELLDAHPAPAVVETLIRNGRGADEQHASDALEQARRLAAIAESLVDARQPPACRHGAVRPLARDDASLLVERDWSARTLAARLDTWIAEADAELTALLGAMNPSARTAVDSSSLTEDGAGPRLSRLVYVCPKPPLVDVVELFVRGQADQMLHVPLADASQAAMGVPWLVNLHHLGSTEATRRTVEQLTEHAAEKPGLLILPPSTDRTTTEHAARLGWPLAQLPCSTRRLGEAIQRLGAGPNRRAA